MREKYEKLSNKCNKMCFCVNRTFCRQYIGLIQNLKNIYKNLMQPWNRIKSSRVKITLSHVDY